MAFRVRHIGNNLITINNMLSKSNSKWNTLDKLINRVIPSSIKIDKNSNIKQFEPISEEESLNKIKNYFTSTNYRGVAYMDAMGAGYVNPYPITQPNNTVKYMIGMDFNESKLPSVIVRNLLENPKWYTAYTPYQAEISQGRLESLFNFQTMICELTDLPISNCSLLDSASAASEALSVAYNFHKQKRPRFLCDINVHPVVKATLKTRADLLGIEVEFKPIISFDFSETASNPFCGVLFSYPDINGNILLYQDKIAEIKANGNPLVITHNDIMSLLLVKPPGSIGADISFGTTQRFGLPLWNGGPHSAFFAMREELTRYMPGRIVGQSKCRNGSDSYRLALQTREQHIRKERALSNICTSQALLANTSTMYAIYHGKKALIDKAIDIHVKRNVLENLLTNLSNKLIIYNNTSVELFFDQVVFSSTKINPKIIQNILKRNGYVVRFEENVNEQNTNGKSHSFERMGKLKIAVNEATTLEDLFNIYNIISSLTSDSNDSTPTLFSIKKLYKEQKDILENKLNDKSTTIFRNRDEKNTISGYPYLSQKIFKFPKSETWMLRYINNLSDKDYSLVSGMIPLGSCTMKLNSTSQMTPISWNELQNAHPYNTFSELNLGYNKMINDLSSRLLEITGLDAINYQSNSGAMGELSGLAVIKAYQRKNKPNELRNIILIPESAHGTNFTSAVLAGFKIKKFKDSLNSEEFEVLCESLGESLAGLMITYPTTYGLFNNDIQEICQAIHNHGGLVYMDGANMNAQSGLTSPGICGADICHLNLHKTFCIPHGGGGPGMGPICVTNELKEFLPSNPLVKTNYCGSQENSYGTITMSPNSSASILSIPLVYLHTMGSEGVKMASENAIANANYLKQMLEPYYNIFSVENVGTELVGHEFIINLDEFYKYGITDKDVAKRLIDYNFHPPTMAWPIPKSIMIEPTESENKEELDRFINAMIQIRKEIDEVKDGVFNKENNVLVNAPHSLDDISNWDFPYSIDKAFYPVESLKDIKHYPRKSRIDDIWGDKNLTVKRSDY